jgi:diguanylate cyclase (GGDEF)-like protein
MPEGSKSPDQNEQQIDLGSSERIPQKPLTRRTIKKAYAEARQNSMKDNLTGLYNERWFTEELERRISEARRKNKSIWIIYADMDKFKLINDEFGHLAGDNILKLFGEIGSRLEEPISRIGGEEFAQIISDDLDLKNIQIVLSRLSLEFKKQSLQTIGREVSLSFGLARSDEVDSAQSLREKADKALYHSKNRGRNRASLYSGTAQNPIYENVDLLTENIDIVTLNN